MIDVIYLIIIAIIISCLILLGLFFLISPARFYDLFRIPYYRLFLTEYNTITKRILQKTKGQWYIIYNKKAYLIPFDNLIKDKSGSIFYADIHNAMPIHCLTMKEQNDLNEITKEEIKKSKSWARKILSKIPYVKRFVLMKEGLINEIVFANKFILNPLFIIDSCMLYIMLTQGITEKILAKKRNLIDTIMDNIVPLGIMITILIIALYYIQHRGGI